MAQLFSLGHIAMISQKTLQMVSWPLRILGFGALLAQIFIVPRNPFSDFTVCVVWGWLASVFLLIAEAAVQHRHGFHKDASLNFLLGVIYFLLAVFTMPAST